MKSKRNPFFRPSALAAATLALAATSASAQTLLFLDNFDTPALGDGNFNNDIATDQSGSAATKTYTTVLGGGWDGAYQRGNGGTWLMFAGAGGFGSTSMQGSLNYDIAAEANTLNSPLEIKFNISVTNGITADEWTSFTIGNQNPFVNAASVGFSSLFRDSGGTQQFSNGADITDLALPVTTFTDGDLITFVISDAAGTGTAFNSDGANDMVKMYVNGLLTDTFTDLDLDVTDQFISFHANSTVAQIDNLSITATGTGPTPPTISGTWTNLVGGPWNTEGNWSGSLVATGSGSTANFNTLNITADTTVNLESRRTVGNLVFGDTDTTSAAGWTLTDNGTPGNILILAGTTPTITVNALGDTKTATISAAVVGSAGLAKAGPGTLTLTAANSYTGATTVSEGTLQVSGQRYFNVGRTTTVASGAVLELVDSDNNFTTLIPTSTITGAGTFRLSGNSTINQSVNGQGGDRLNFAMESGGLIDLQGTSSIVNGGWQVVNWTNNLADMNIASGATFDLWDGQDVTLNALTGSGTVNKGFPSGSPTLTLGIADGSGDFSGTIQNTGDPIALVKTGSGTQTLSGANSYTGNTTVNEGTLRLGNGTLNSNLADSADVIVAAGAILDLDFTGTDDIDELWLDSVAQAPGIYGAGNSGGFITGTGTLTVQNGPIADPFLAWIDTFFPGETDPLIIGATADPDNDGIENLVEYVLQGGDPSVSNTGILPTLDASGANFVFTYLRRTAATGTTQTFQYGNDLSGWTDVPVTDGGLVAITSPEEGIEQVVITVAKGTETKLFGRLQVVK